MVSRGRRHRLFEKPHPFVSRGGVKLAAALDHFHLSPEGLVCLDIGASTGGFTEVLLERGAQGLCRRCRPRPDAPKLRAIRAWSCATASMRAIFPDPSARNASAIVADVSFIGLRLALPPALAMAAPGAWLVALVKPQFEVGRFAVGKGGIVRDAEAQDAALADLTKWLAAQSGWTVIGNMESPIHGGDGNREFLLAAQKVVTAVRLCAHFGTCGGCALQHWSLAEYRAAEARHGRPRTDEIRRRGGGRRSRRGAARHAPPRRVQDRQGGATRDRFSRRANRMSSSICANAWC